MSDRTIHIALLLPSALLAEGISALIRQCEKPASVVLAEKFGDLEIQGKGPLPDAVIMDPVCIVNRAKEFTALRKNMPGTLWIGLVSSIYDPQILSRFDHLIHLSDTAATITGLLS
jgi:hypothetical protein